MANLAIKITNVFGPKLYQTFNVSSDKSPADILDMVKYQWQMCQLEKIPESLYRMSKEKTCNSNSPSRNNNYGEYALKYCKIFADSTNKEDVRLDHYLSSIRNITDKNDVKHQQLFFSAKAFLSISHGNIVPEREYFINKFLLSIHGSNLKEEIICMVVGLENI